MAASRDLITRFVSSHPPAGVLYAQLVRSTLHAHETQLTTEAAALDLFGQDHAARIMAPLTTPAYRAAVRSAVTAGSTAEGNWGAGLSRPNAAAAEFLAYVQPQTLIGKFGANGIPALKRVPFYIDLIEQTQPAIAAWVGQGAAKAVTELGFSSTSITEHDCAAIVALSDKLLRRSGPDIDLKIRDALVDGVVAMKDLTFMSDSAGTPLVIPAGLLNGVTPTASAGNDAESVRLDVRALLAAHRTNRYGASGAVLVMSADLAANLATMGTDDQATAFPGITAAGGILLGLPVLVTDYMPTSSNGQVVALVHAPNVFYAEDGAETLLSQHADLAMDSAPGDSAPTNSLFHRNQTGVRVVQPVGWAKRTGSVVAIDDVNWGEES